MSGRIMLDDEPTTYVIVNKDERNYLIAQPVWDSLNEAIVNPSPKALMAAADLVFTNTGQIPKSRWFRVHSFEG